MAKSRIAIIVGNNRRDSINRKREFPSFPHCRSLERVI